jgi:hypothetical protein
METLRRLFSSTSLELDSSADSTPVHNEASSMEPSKVSRLLELPNEIIHQIVSHLQPLTLVKLSTTCQSLRAHAENDHLWAKFVQDSLPFPQSSPTPLKSWKELYISHHPYWFLTRQRLWFAGNGLVGQLIIARYDPRVGNIEAYHLLADLSHDQHTTNHWEWEPDVLIHSFEPRVHLFLDSPVVRLTPQSPLRGNRLRQEVPMQPDTDGRAPGIRSTLFLTRAIPPERQTSAMLLWPPRIIPSTTRVRNDSASKFRAEGHIPSRFDQMSDTAFRMRKWSEFRASGPGSRPVVRMGEDVFTFSTLPPECYTPTAEKPYQGIWVGDYAGHGCEFLLILQTLEPKTRRILSDAGQLLERPSHLVPLPNDSQAVTLEATDPPGCSGRIEAIKLTGDPNVPRGEYTWISEDIGRRGLIRVAEEETFKGSRIVRSWGHIAAHGFQEDRYMESQLIMISHDCLAQYWEVRQNLRNNAAYD